MQTRSFHLRLEPWRLAIARLGSRDPVPEWADGPFVCVTRTPDELSIVCPEARVPHGMRASGGWRAFSVKGPLDMELVGVLASLAAPAADAGVPIFVVSTFDTDYLLTRAPDKAAAAWRDAGHTVDL